MAWGLWDSSFPCYICAIKNLGPGQYLFVLEVSFLAYLCYHFLLLFLENSHCPWLVMLTACNPDKVWCDEKGPSPVASSSPNPSPLLSVRKASGRSRLPGTLYNSWPVLLLGVKVIKNKESLRDCLSQEEPKETWCQCVMGSSGAKKGH